MHLEPFSGGLQVADASRIRQSSAASGKPARLGGTARGARAPESPETRNPVETFSTGRQIRILAPF